jgi:pimeloyl-ACP methyl ester carboxylesterase
MARADAEPRRLGARRVSSTDGVTLAVYESGDPHNPTVVAVHGYPDNHAVWDGVVELLAERFHAVSYDVRGSGASDKPAAVGAYRIARLVDDLSVVLDAVSPAVPVHLLAHDWGSIQAWPALTDDRLAGRIATFTSISGPSLDHAAAWFRQSHKHPRKALRQLVHSYYVAAFQLPGLPEFAARHGVVDRGVRAAAWGSSPAAGPGLPRTEADKVNGLSLYRANMFASLGRPRPLPVPIPVQVIVPEQDAFVTPDLAVEAPRPWVAELTVRRIPGGHWVVAERPDAVARLAGEFIAGRIYHA